MGRKKSLKTLLKEQEKVTGARVRPINERERVPVPSNPFRPSPQPHPFDIDPESQSEEEEPLSERDATTLDELKTIARDQLVRGRLPEPKSGHHEAAVKTHLYAAAEYPKSFAESLGKKRKIDTRIFFLFEPKTI